MKDRPRKMEVQVFSGHRVNGFPLASLRIAPLEVSIRRLFPQSLKMDSGRRNTSLQAVGFRGSRVLGCGSHGFELSGLGFRSSKIAIKLSDFGFGSPESLLEPPFIGFVHCTIGCGFRLSTLSQTLGLSASLSLSISLNLSLSSPSYSVSLSLSISLCVQVGRT